MAAAWASAVSPSQTWEGATTRGLDGLCSLIRTFPQTRHAVSERWVHLSEDRPGPPGWSGRGSSADRRERCDRAPGGLTEAIEIQEVVGPRWEIILRVREIIGVAQGDGGMPPVGKLDDEIGIRSATKADDLDLLAPERMMGMGDGDQSRRRLGRR